MNIIEAKKVMLEGKKITRPSWKERIENGTWHRYWRVVKGELLETAVTVKSQRPSCVDQQDLLAEDYEVTEG